jgi:hypothetical protein
MAHFVLTRASLAAWGATPAVLAAEFWSLDNQVYKAINGDDGGTWAPSSAITIGGSGISVTGPAEFSDIQTAEFNGPANFNDNMTLDSAATFSLSGASTIELGSGTRINVNSGAFIDIESGADLDVKSGGEIDIENGGSIVVTSGGVVTVQSGGAISIEGLSGIVLGASSSISAASGSKVTGTLSQECRLTKTGAAARTIERLHDATADAAAFFDCSYDIEFYSHTIATGVSHTLRITGGSQNPVSGDTIRFHIDKTGAGTIAFVNEGMGSSIAIVGSGTGHVRLTFVFRSTHWRLLDAWGSSGTSITPGGHA